MKIIKKNNGEIKLDFLSIDKFESFNKKFYIYHDKSQIVFLSTIFGTNSLKTKKIVNIKDFEIKLEKLLSI